ncbi:hypothetical protein ABB55_22280 [Prosthecomicrobium hirschii]|uniref:Uncharacterized protein n=1 Tax=Prosthecodimorpha hirschii TaxID=665126 RepID=A0A0P6WII9_9HYPH|nr:hypothetical protein [Prosthecomicrobium hirschii]KPL54616.1 hypothetical protein ABB55_22280 [Prosthecomicrobium hirschii]TPQ50292.1 hypothetical protein C2U72_14130 [Prosthecomicrobium hirschii]
MTTIAISQFKAIQAPDNKEVRIDSQDQVTTAKRGFFGRVVRFFNPSIQNSETRETAGQLLKSLRAKYGNEVGTEAFMRARSDLRISRNGNLFVDVSKPITAREVRVALQEAKKLKKELAGVSELSPYGGSRFDDLAKKVGVDPDTLTGAQKRFYSQRLKDMALSDNVGRQRHAQKNGDEHPSFASADDLEKIAGKLLKYAAGLDDKTIRSRDQAWTSAHGAGKQFAEFLAGSREGGPVELVKALRIFDSRLGNLKEETLTGGATGGVGGDDLATARFVGMDSMLARMSPDEARALYDDFMKQDSNARQLAFGLGAVLSHSGMENKKDQELAMANSSAAQSMWANLKEFIKCVGERGGVEDIDSDLDTMMNAGMDIDRKDLASGQVPGKILSDAGLTDGARAVKSVGQILPTVLEEGVVQLRIYKQEQENERLAMLNEQNL